MGEQSVGAKVLMVPSRLEEDDTLNDLKLDIEFQKRAV